MMTEDESIIRSLQQQHKDETLLQRAERAESERAQALAAQAELRAALSMFADNYLHGDESVVQYFNRRIVALNHALSTECGQGWLSPEKAKELEAQRDLFLAQRTDEGRKVKLLVEALEKIDSIATDTAKFCALPTEMQQMQDVAKRMIAAVKQP